MYAIVHNNFVILTQPNWNTRMFTSILEEECNIQRRILLADENEIPLILNENTKIVRVINNIPEYNPKIEYLDGPNYTITEENVVSNYVVRPLNLEIAKGNLLDQLPALRYEREKKSIDIIIQDTKLNISTDRETRAVFTNKLLAIGENTINFKFDEGWLNLSKTDLEYIIQQIDFAVQEAFDWELSKTNEINACNTHEKINNIVLVKKLVPKLPMGI